MAFFLSFAPSMSVSGSSHGEAYVMRPHVSTRKAALLLLQGTSLLSDAIRLRTEIATTCR